MREPEDKKRKRKRKPPPPGGKALERLRQFEQERGLEPTNIEPDQPQRPDREKKEKAAEK